MTPRQELCRAQLNRPGKQSHIDIDLKENEQRSYESVTAQCTRANNPLHPLTPRLSCSTSPLGMKGMWAAWEGDSRLEVRVTTGLIHVTRQGWNPSAHPGQWLSRHIPPPLLLPTSLTGLEWVQMCDGQTLPLWSPYWSHGAQQRLAHSLRAPGQSVTAHSHIICRRLCEDDRGDTVKRRIFITRSNLMGYNLEANITNVASW